MISRPTSADSGRSILSGQERNAGNKMHRPVKYDCRTRPLCSSRRRESRATSLRQRRSRHSSFAVAPPQVIRPQKGSAHAERARVVRCGAHAPRCPTRGLGRIRSETTTGPSPSRRYGVAQERCPRARRLQRVPVCRVHRRRGAGCRIAPAVRWRRESALGAAPGFVRTRACGNQLAPCSIRPRTSRPPVRGRRVKSVPREYPSRPDDVPDVPAARPG